MPDSERIEVSVIYALPNDQIIVRVLIAPGASVADAVRACGLLPSISPSGEVPRCAIFGEVVEPTRTLKQGDRVEILRPLLIDPKEGRRRAASAARSGGKRTGQ
jgi:uncharacterized protein